MGHDFPKDRDVGEFVKPWLMGENTHVSPFLSFSPIIYFCQNVVELVIAWNGKSMGKNSNWAENHFFEKRVLTSLARKMPKNVCHSAMHSRFPFFLHSPSRWGSWEQLEFFFPVFSFHVFGCWLHFSHGWEVIFVMPRIGLVFLMFLGMLVHFPLSHNYFCLPHA